MLAAGRGINFATLLARAVHRLRLAEFRRRKPMRRSLSIVATALGCALVAIQYGCSLTSSGAQQSNGTSGSGSGSGSGGTSTSIVATTCTAPTPITPLTDAVSGKTCHPSACTASFCARGDVSPLGKDPATKPLQDRLATLDCSPHSVPPLQIFAEADPAAGGQSQLFMYYLLDSTSFQPSVFTTRIPGVNDMAMLTVFGANCGLDTIGAVRLALEPKPGLPKDPDDIRAFIDVFTDIRGLFVINNESGWYEGWMIHDLKVAAVAPSSMCDKTSGAAPFGMITAADAAALAKIGSNNVPGNVFTVDGQAPHLPSPTDHFPDKVTNVVPINLSMGAYNALQQSDAHNYWEFNYTTNWIHPLYELPFAGGFPKNAPTDPATTYLDGLIGAMGSLVPGNSPASNNRDSKLAIMFGDNPDLPRDADKFDADVDSQREFRQRFVPSGIAHEALLNAYQRLASFEPDVHSIQQRLLDGYKAAVALVDTNGDGIVSAAEGDPDTANSHCPQGDNTCIYLPARSYNRFAVTREINDGLLGPRFAPSTRGWTMAGTQVTGFQVLATSEGQDSDDR
jgi:hypothetical protein